MSFQSFEEIDAWKDARRLSRMIKIYRARAIASRDWAWADQISRTAISIMANIAEGNDCQSDIEFCKFLGYAKRSAAEVRSHLYYGLDEEYVQENEFMESSDMTVGIGAKLAKLMR